MQRHPSHQGPQQQAAQVVGLAQVAHCAAGEAGMRDPLAVGPSGREHLHQRHAAAQQAGRQQTPGQRGKDGRAIAVTGGCGPCKQQKRRPGQQAQGLQRQRGRQQPPKPRSGRRQRHQPQGAEQWQTAARRQQPRRQHPHHQPPQRHGDALVQQRGRGWLVDRQLGGQAGRQQAGGQQCKPWAASWGDRGAVWLGRRRHRSGWAERPPSAGREFNHGGCRPGACGRRAPQTQKRPPKWAFRIHTNNNYGLIFLT